MLNLHKKLYIWEAVATLDNTETKFDGDPINLYLVYTLINENNAYNK